jgi:photosystem II stability/assembly factor-like uncharacterized protein
VTSITSFRRCRGLAVAAVLLCGALPAAAQEIAYAHLWRDGIDFQAFLDAADRQRDAWQNNYAAGDPEPADVDRARQLSTAGLRLLVVAEEWCGDSLHTIPYLARFAETVEGIELRLVDSEAGDAIMAAHHTPDGRKATPTVIVLDSNDREMAAWVERPSNLQEWFLANEEGLRRRALYDRKYEWYTEDRGRSTVAEIVDLMIGVTTAPTGPTVTLTPRDSGTQALLQAISPVDDRVIWASGHEGTWALSLDGGDTWHSGVVAGAETMQFRDVHGVDAHTAFLMSAGSGDDSRIYRTDDAGANWRLQYRNAVDAAFFDCFDFWDDRRGLAFSDSVDGELFVLRTVDGETWDRIPAARLPPALAGEGSFAASGTCLRTGPEGLAWIGTGAAAAARVLITRDYGERWTAHRTPMPAGESSGIASLSFRDALAGAALGGNIAAPDELADTVITTRDGGISWTTGGRQPFTGAVYGSSFVPGTNWLVAAGPGGVALSTDGGGVWRQLDDRNHWAVGFATASRGWALGPDGRITEITIQQPEIH